MRQNFLNENLKNLSNFYCHSASESPFSWRSKHFPIAKTERRKTAGPCGLSPENVSRETFKRKSSSEHSRPKKLTENMEIYKIAAEAQASSRYDFAGDPLRARGPAVPNRARTKGQGPCPLSAFVSPVCFT